MAPLKFSTICSHLLVAQLSFVKKFFFFFLAELSFLNLSVGDYYSIRLAPQHASTLKVVFAIKYSYINQTWLKLKCQYVNFNRYEEDYLKVGRKKTNLMFIGDGKGITIISGGKSVFDNITTFRTASFGKLLLITTSNPHHLISRRVLKCNQSLSSD